MDTETMAAAEDGIDNTDKMQETTAKILHELELTDDSIQSQSLPELQASNEKIDLMLANTTKVKEGSARIKLLALNLFYERKAAVLARIALIKEQAQAESIRQALEQLPESQKKSELESRIALLQVEMEKSRQQMQEMEAEKNRKLVDLQQVATQEKLKMDIYERRARILQSWFARESVASILGAFLLLVLTITMVVAMFTNVTISDVVKSAFLVILGYFFGQAASKVAPTAKGTEQQ